MLLWPQFSRRFLVSDRSASQMKTNQRILLNERRRRMKFTGHAATAPYPMV